MPADISVRWRLDVVGEDAVTKLLQQDRMLQRSLRETDAQYDRTARSAQVAAARQQRGLQGVLTNATRAARTTNTLAGATSRAATEARVLVSAEQQAATAMQNSTVAARNQAVALRRLREQQALTARAQASRERLLNRSSAGAVAAVRGPATLAAGAAGFGLVGAIKDAAGFQQEMANVQARLLTTRRDMEGLSKFALQLGARTQFSARQAADAMGELAAQGFNTRQIYKVLPGTLSLAAAAGTDLANAAAIQTEALHGFGLQADQANHIADVLAQTSNKSATNIDDLAESIKYVAPVAHSFNQTMEDMLASVGLLGNVGIKGSQAGTTLRRALVQLVKPSQRTLNLLDSLGISADEFGEITNRRSGDMRALPEILGRMSEATADMAKPDKRRLFAQVFGVEALPGILALMDKGRDKIDALSGSLRKSDGAAKRAASIMRNTVTGSWDNFTGSIETSTITLSRRFLPGLQRTLDEAADDVNRFVDNTENLDAIEETATALIDTGKAAGEALLPLVRAGAGLVKTFSDLPDPLKVAVLEFGLLWAVARKFRTSGIFEGLAGSIAGVRGQLRGVPADAAAARAALAGGPGAGGAAPRAGGAGFFVDSKGRVTNQLPRRRLPRLNVSGRGAGGGAAGAVLGTVMSGGDPLTGAISGAAAGSIAGPWGALIGGAGGAFGSAILGWIDRHGDEAGKRLGRKLAPGLSESLQQQLGKTALDVDKLKGEITHLQSDIERRGQRPNNLTSSRPGGQTSRGGPDAQRELEARRRELAERNRQLGRGVAGGVIESAQQGGGRQMRAGFIASQLIQRLKGQDVQARAEGARTVVEWAKGMEAKGKLAEGSADRIAERIKGRFTDITTVLKREGTATSKALADGLSVPGAVDNARKTLGRLNQLWKGLPDAAKLNVGNAEEMLETAARKIKDRLPHLTGEARKAAEKDLDQIRAAIKRLRTSAENDGEIAAVAMRSSFRMMGLKADQAADAVSGLRGVFHKLANVSFEGVVGQLKDLANVDLSDITGTLNTFFSGSWTSNVTDFLDNLTPRKPKKNRKRTGGIIRFSAGGLVPSLVSPGEQVLYGDRSWTVPGTPTAADSVFAPLPVGAAVLTFDGQARMAAGEPLGSVLANQAPHFQKGGRVLSPGQMATLAYQHGVRPKRAAVRMGAIGMRESHGRSWVHNYDPPRDDSWGLWQINVLPNANPRFRSWNLTNPDVNAKAMSILWKAGGEGPWGGYPESSFSGWLDDAARGFGKRATLNVPTVLGASRTRAGLVTDALAQGISAGQAGLTRAEIRAANAGVYGARVNPIFEAIRSARQPTSRKVTIDGVTSRRRRSNRSDPAGYALRTMDGKPVAAWIAPILQWARRHGWSGSVTSGYRTRDQQLAAAKSYGLEHYPGGNPFGSNHMKKVYPGGAVDVTNASQLAQVLHGYRGSRKLVWAGPTIGDWVHFSANGHRRGGRIRRFQNGGVAGLGALAGRLVAGRAGGSAPSGVLAGKVGSALDDLLGSMVVGKLTKLRGELLAEARKGGTGKAVQRAREQISLIDFELGRRIGLIDYRVQKRNARSELFTGYMQRADRRRMIGADDDTRAVAEQQGALSDAQMAEALARRNIRAKRRQLRLARSAGAGREEIDRITADLEQEGANLDEAVTAGMEATGGIMQAVKQAFDNARQKVLDNAQELVDMAQHGLTMGQGDLDRLDADQRLAGITDTPAAMRARAAEINSRLIPQLQAYGQQLNSQLATQIDQGDVIGQRATLEAIQSNGTAIANAMADAGDLIRQAAEKAAQDIVDLASHNRTMADLGRQRLELEQRLAGVYEQGGQARADFIRRTEIPALEAELSALRNQQAVEMQVGNLELARQIAEAIAAKQNDILQAQLDATEEVAANTKPRPFGGSLAFAFGDETLTDELVAAGNGL